MTSRPRSLAAGLSEADRLMRQRKWLAARELLETLDQRYPNNADVLGSLVNVNYELKDIQDYQRASERLIQLTPDDADVTLGLAGAYALNTRPALALRTFRRFIERFPDDPRAADVRKTVAGLEDSIEPLLNQVGLSGTEGIQLSELHEEVQSALSQGDYPRVYRLAEQLLKRKPDFAPVLNNMSQAYLMEGKLDQAIATTQRVLAFDPGNIHALANLVAYHYRLGRLDEAREYAERLVHSDQPAADKWLKIAEALSFLGDDAGVLAAFQAAEREGKLASGEADAMLYHLAAVAELRLGHEAEAKSHWRQALKLNPGQELARENLDDLRKPIGERHAPWPFDFGNWTTRRAVADLNTQVANKKGEEALTNAARRFLQKHPEIAALVPALLDRGDPPARQFALMVAKTARTPELLAALRDFALGQRGPDTLRHQAIQVADDAGLFSERQVRMWVRGEWQDLTLMGFEITEEPTPTLGPQVEPLASEGHDALVAGQGAKAEQLLRRALELEPDAPSLLNNLAAALSMQGRNAEAEAIIRELHARHPDYLFARVGVARLHIRDGDLDAAEELLKPLLMRRRFHTTEAAALFAAQVDLLIARGNTDAARSWLAMWADIAPEHPEVIRRQIVLEAGDGLKKLFGRRKRR
jgi:tetratricopeptide (TPR) repeat protein